MQYLPMQLIPLALLTGDTRCTHSTTKPTDIRKCLLNYGDAASMVVICMTDKCHLRLQLVVTQKWQNNPFSHIPAKLPICSGINQQCLVTTLNDDGTTLINIKYMNHHRAFTQM